MIERESDSPFWKWPGGIAAPLIILVFAIRIWLAGEVTLGFRRGVGVSFDSGGGWHVGESPNRNPRMPMTLDGFDATLFAWCMIAVAVIGHFHFFWTHTPKLCPYEPLGKYFGIALLVFPLWWLIFRQFINFI